MFEFESFVYLDVQRTGSTFISRILQKYNRVAMLRCRRHKGMEADCDRSKFYFISVRDPLDSYLSLYSHGCGDRGNTRARLGRMEMSQLYDGTPDGFGVWLQFVLKAEHADMLDRGYCAMGDLASLVGFQSYRYLRLALPDAHSLLSGCTSKDDLREIHARQKLPEIAIRYETLVADVSALLDGKLRGSLSDPEAALDFARTSPPLNSSTRVDAGGDFPLDEELLRDLRAREWFLSETFGYCAAPRAACDHARIDAANAASDSSAESAWPLSHHSR
jgi:hypothetical protein